MRQKGEKMKPQITVARILVILSVALTCAMCSVVAYQYSSLLCAQNHLGGSAPTYVAFLFAIPFVVAIAISLAVSYLLYKNVNKK